MIDIVDFILELVPIITEDFEPSVKMLKLADEIIASMNKTNAKRAKITTADFLARQLECLRRQCLAENRPGHPGPIPVVITTYEREGIEYT